MMKNTITRRMSLVELNETEQKEMESILNEPEYSDLKDEDLTYGTRMQRIGERRGILLGVENLCKLLGIHLTAERCGRIEGMNLGQLRELTDHLLAHRAWPQ
jgi:hypothetical protein